VAGAQDMSITWQFAERRSAANPRSPTESALRGGSGIRFPLAWEDERASPAPRLTTAQRRQDVWLAAGLLVAAVLSAWLGSTASVYGTESAPFSWALVYAVALTVPIAFRRRVPIVVLVVIAVAFFTGVSLRIPEVYVGNVTLFIAMYTVGAWVEDRRRATRARARDRRHVRVAHRRHVRGVGRR
jgi:hypothetical protein